MTGEQEQLRVVVVGATGNIGTSALSALAGDPSVGEIVGVARRLPSARMPKVKWVAADVTTDRLEPLFANADAVVHLAWLIQPSHKPELLRRVNLDGSARVFAAASAEGVPALVYASSVGAYSPGPKDRAVDESHPTNGIESSFYSRHKAKTERMLDELAARAPELRIVRLRPALVFKRDASSEIRRLFAGPLLPSRLMRPELIPVVPVMPGLRFQAVHSADVGEAIRLAVRNRSAEGAFNLAAPPVLDRRTLSEALEARAISIPAGLLRALLWLTWKARLQPTPPGWLDMALAAPIMDTTRAQRELGWKARVSSQSALRELLAGMSDRSGIETPVLHANAGVG